MFVAEVCNTVSCGQSERDIIFKMLGTDKIVLIIYFELCVSAILFFSSSDEYEEGNICESMCRAGLNESMRGS